MRKQQRDTAAQHLARIQAQDQLMPDAIRAVMSVPTRPASQLERGRRHQHDWQQWGDDRMYDRCAVCDAVRASEIKQGGLF